MKLHRPWMIRSEGYLAARATQTLLSTLDFRAVSCDPTVDPKWNTGPRRFLFITWHENIIVGLPLRANCRLLGIASEHRDGELLNCAARQLGWQMVRGSSNQGGVGALKELLREQSRHINITPDGPRGPRRSMGLGSIYLASRAKLPIVCCAYGFDHPWRLGSWDRCIIPKPFSRARAIYSGPITVPERVEREQLDHYRMCIENLLNQMTTDAEQWATEGFSKPREYHLRQRSVDRRVQAEPHLYQTPLSTLAAEWVEKMQSTSAELTRMKAA